MGRTAAHRPSGWIGCPLRRGGLGDVYSRHLPTRPARHEKRFRIPYLSTLWFCGRLNPNTGWQADDVIGIDVGITLLSAENLRTGNVWKWFMSNPEAPRAF